MNVSPVLLTAFVEKLFVAAGLSDSDARLCAEIHVLTGIARDHHSWFAPRPSEP